MTSITALLKDYRGGISGLLLFTGLLCWGNSLWIAGKAVVAQQLIESAWKSTLSEGHAVKPWPWADTWPVAAMEFPSQNETLFALAGSTGTSLAFGPGHLDGTALPEEPGTKVFSAHRDTHFSFLENIAIGEIFHLQSNNGVWQSYRVTEKTIVDSTKTQWMIDQNRNEVHLITCYPFNSATLNPDRRFVVVAAQV
ncbi:class GN sortase [Aestuariibacter sp. A3R04]|uniref:class GN sortase n=1 Tax=Aestuariibacter sp. A3R04 TaxID=2841571 RepID=UPI001C08D18A|nr:class GN sortase [Aestuariibacter sp. A3R04]MBU3023700.1 class GN sortase [Aestuariibacter sp. A3R04]